MASTTDLKARTSMKTASALSRADYALAPQRQMTVIAQDPSVRREISTPGTEKRTAIVTAKVTIPAEDLLPGPIGYRLQMVDYDSTTGHYNGKHTLPTSYEHEPKAWQQGRPSIVKDFAFHAQNTYALVMKTLARFEFALGRRIGWSFDTHQLKVAPHGMHDANAFYSPDVEGLVFGYFKGTSGTPVYTCLSHDIVVHETTHALLDALRERYMDASHPDQGAFHEGFADVVALLSVFSLPEVVEHLLLPPTSGGTSLPTIQREAVSFDALRKSVLFGLAEEMGGELEEVRGNALRHSSSLEPDKSLKDTEEYLESHRRGELFVAAVMRGFVAAWSQRILGMGVAGQTTFPIRRVAEEGADVADVLATMWIRAIDYMPPVHLTFGDALSAALTADLEVRPDDSRYRLREHMLEQFRAFGFEPASNRKDPVGVWNPPPKGLNYDRVRFESMQSDKDEVFRFIWENRKLLELHQEAFTQVLSVRPSVRIGVDGFIVRETIAEYYQVARLTPEEMASLGVRAPAEYVKSLRSAREHEAAPDEEEVTETQTERTEQPESEEARPGLLEVDDTMTTPLYGGAVLIFDEYGRVKYWVHNDIFGRRQRGRLQYLWDEGILQPGKGGSRLRGTRLSTIHRLRALNARANPSEAW